MINTCKKDMVKSCTFLTILLCLLVCVATGCSSTKQAQSQGGAGGSTGGSALTAGQDEELAKQNLTVARSYTPKGIVINYRSDKLLNSYDDAPHSLMLIVYQMDNINAYIKLIKDNAGIQKLLAFESFDKSVTGMERFFIEPEETSTLEINRLENTKWVGIVAGYYNIMPEQMVRIYEIPVVLEKTGIYGFRKTQAKTTELTVNLYLGPNSIQEVQNQ